MPDQSRMSDRLIARDRTVGTAECIRETGARRREGGKTHRGENFRRTGIPGIGHDEGRLVQQTSVSRGSMGHSPVIERVKKHPDRS